MGRGALGNKEVSNRHKCPDCDGRISKENSKSKSRVWKRVMWFTRRGKNAKNDICHCHTDEALNPGMADRHSNSWSFTRRASRKFRGSSRRRQCKSEPSKKFFHPHEKQDEPRTFCESSQPSTRTGSAYSSNPNSPTATGSFCDFRASGNAGCRGSKNHKNASVLTEIAREINPPIKNNSCDYVHHPPKQLSKSVSLVNYISCCSPTLGHVRRSKSFPGSQSCTSPSKRRFINVANKTFGSFSPPLKQKCYGLQRTATFCGKVNAEFRKPCIKKSKSLNTTELTRLEKTASLGEIRDQSGSVVGVVHFYKSPKKMSRRINSLNHEVRNDSAFVEDECEVSQASLNSISNCQDGIDCHLKTNDISNKPHSCERTLLELYHSNKCENEMVKNKTMLNPGFPLSSKKSKNSKNSDETSQSDCLRINNDVEWEQNSLARLKISRLNSNHYVDRLIQCYRKGDVSGALNYGNLSTGVDGGQSVASCINYDETAMICLQRSDVSSNQQKQFVCEDEANVSSTINSNGMQVEKNNMTRSQMSAFCSDQNNSSVYGNQYDTQNAVNDFQASFLDLVDNVDIHNVKGTSKIVHEPCSANDETMCTSLSRSDIMIAPKLEKVSKIDKLQCHHRNCMACNLMIEQPFQKCLEDVQLSCDNHMSNNSSCLGGHYDGDSIENVSIPCHCDKGMSADCSSSHFLMRSVCLSPTLHNESKSPEQFEFQTKSKTFSDVESTTGSVTNSCCKDMISFDYEPEFRMPFDEDALFEIEEERSSIGLTCPLNEIRCGERDQESKTGKRKQPVDTLKASKNHDIQVDDNIKLNHAASFCAMFESKLEVSKSRTKCVESLNEQREVKLSHKISNSCIDHDSIEVLSNTANSAVRSIASEQAHLTEENVTRMCQSVPNPVLSQEESQTHSHSSTLTSPKTPEFSKTERSQEVVECTRTSDYESMFDACFSPPKEDIPIHTWKTSESDLKSDEIAQPVPGETFKMRTEVS